MAGLPLYLMAIPLRKSLAAGISVLGGRRSLHAAVASATDPGAHARLAGAFQRVAELRYNNFNRVISTVSTARQLQLGVKLYF